MFRLQISEAKILKILGFVLLAVLLCGGWSHLVDASEFHMPEGGSKGNWVSDANMPGDTRWLHVTSFGHEVGEGLLHSGDLDGNGGNELIFTGGGERFDFPKALFVLSSDLETVLCVLEHPFPLIHDYAVFQADSDPAMEVVIVTSTEVIVVDGSTCEIELIHAFALDVPSAGIGDVDNDGTPEIVFSLGDDLFVAPWNDLESPLRLGGMGGAHIAVGRLSRPDGDDIGVVIPRNSMSDVVLLQGDTLEVLYVYEQTSAEYVGFAEFNADPLGEIVLGERNLYREIQIYEFMGSDPISGAIRVTNYRSLGYYDIDQNGVDEIFFGTGLDARVFDINGSLLRRFHDSCSGVTKVHFTDFDNDGAPDIFWNCGLDSTATDYLYLSDFSNGAVLWKSPDFNGKFSAGIQDDNNFSLLFESADSGFDPGGIVGIDRRTGGRSFLLHANGAISERDWFAVSAGNPEFGDVLCASNEESFRQTLRCFNTSTLEEIWRRDHPEHYFHWIVLNDIDSDGDVELYGLRSDGYLYSYSAIDGSFKWRSERFDIPPYIDWWAFKSVGFVDDELWYLDPLGNLVFLDPLTGATIKKVGNSDLTAITVVGDRVYGAIQGVGVGLLDVDSFEFEEMIYPTAEPVELLRASSGGEVLLVAHGLAPDLSAVVVSTTDRFSPWQIGQMKFWDAEFVGSNELLIATTFGAALIDLKKLNTIMSDRFELMQ